jgi:rSAM/selenodomain-associated transferase 2
VVVDGGSTDGTAAAAAVAAASGARVIQAPRGRGIQLGAGAAAVRGDWLLFLHGDTVLAPGWIDAVRRHMDDPAMGDRAGYFRFALDDASPAARRLERLVALRCHLLALPYGDQGLLIARRLYDGVGGFDAVPLMEDVALVRRLGRSRLARLDATAVTSARRYRQGGYWRRPLRNLCCLALYYLGVPPQRILRLYR